MCERMKASEGESVIYSGHPSWKSMLDLHVAGLVAAAAGGAIARLVTSEWGSGIAVFAAILALSVLVGWVRRLSTHYTITDRRLHIRAASSRASSSTRRSTASRTSRRTRRCSERMLRIGTVDFDTAATDESEFNFEGVATPRQVVAAVDQAQQAAAAASAATALPADAQ